MTVQEPVVWDSGGNQKLLNKSAGPFGRLSTNGKGRRKTRKKVSKTTLSRIIAVVDNFNFATAR